ncbi:CD48 antigen-like [Engraulis encrasicolus]|uniref:CD48 antigen-like n=1 Tax=Engraulis encrasicolus TaxID=184585 RepID=UPI002FD014EA
MKLALLLLLLHVTQAVDTMKYALMNGSIELTGVVPDVQITSVLWNWGLDKVAEWDVDEHFIFPSNCPAELNNETWALTISQLQPSCGGQYTLLINEKETSSFQLNVLELVSEPSITKECNYSSCNLTCEGNDTSYTEYTWTDDEGGNTPGSILQVEKNETLDLTYTCNFSNPLSSETRSISYKELFPPLELQTRTVIIIAVTVLASLIVLVAIIAVGIFMCRRSTKHGYEAGRTNDNGPTRDDGGFGEDSF